MPRVQIGLPPQQVSENTWRVAVRITEGTLRVGERFRSALFAEVSGSAPQPISAQLIALRAYRHDFQELKEGMTAELELKTEGPVSLADGMTLDTTALT